MISKGHKILRLATALVLASMPALTGCVADDMLMLDNGKAGYITLTLSNSKYSSRAVEPSVATKGENIIRNAILCFYPTTNPGNKPLLVERVNTFKYNEQNQATVDVAIGNDVKEVLFPEGVDKCSVYAIVNPTFPMTDVTEEMTFADIKKLPITADFVSQVDNTRVFTMDGTSDEIQIHGRGTTTEYADGQVNLQRCASKITLAVKVDDKIEIKDNNDNVVETWKPQLSNISVLITDGVTQSQLNSYEYATTGNLKEEDYYSTSNNAQNPNHRSRQLKEVTGETTEFPYALSNPFYTFPSTWDPTKAESHHLYMTLMVPWGQVEEDEDGTETISSYKTSYYTVPVIHGNTIGRNISYRVNIAVSMLGSFTPDEPFVLTPLSYQAVEWGTKEQEVTLADTRYLVVDQTSYTLNNEESIQIPIYTSHETEVTAKTMTYYLYNTTAQGREQAVTIGNLQYDNTINRGSDPIYTAEFHNAAAGDATDQNYLEFDHKMLTWTPHQSGGATITWPQSSAQNATNAINNINYYTPTTDAAYSRYVTTITIAHKNHPEFTQTITITQYPQMYITATPNVMNATGNTTPQQGNTFVNGSQSTQSGNWYTLYSLGSSSSSNPNQYVVTITQLNDGEDYIIGDPRESNYTDLTGWKNNFNGNRQTAPNNAWATAPDMSGTQRKLKYYYPTDGSASKARWIAPSFRIASSFGICPNANSYIQDKARCASYQELSRPAGRWRMPTVAEMEYIMKLSQQGKIPALFSGTAYMTAQGYTSTTFTDGKLTTPTTTNGNTAVRCVYDEWYWGNDTIVPGTNGRYTFTWGDKERTTVTPQPNP